LTIIFVALSGCSSEQKNNSVDSLSTKNSKTLKSNYRKETVDSLIRVGALDPDSVPDLPPSEEEERQRLTKKYDQMETLDSTFVSGTDTLNLHIKYFCLKNVDLILPKLYDPDNKNPKEFVTHPFVADILVIHNRDTVLKKQFSANDLNPFFTDNFGGSLKKYGSILDIPSLVRRNKDQSRIVLDFPIAIPATDLGLGKFLIISKRGDYTFAETY
jgi:hypothetical protein